MARDQASDDIGTELPTLPLLLATARRLSLGPEDLIQEIARMLFIPDYYTIRGLKQCHDAFDSISSKLEQVYVLRRGSKADPMAADKLAGAIIAIYGRMSFDSLLRTRIFAETGFVTKAISLLHSVTARSIVMPVLSHVTHLSDVDILTEISRFTSTILDCVEAHLDDLQYVERAVCVLTHCTAMVLENADPDPDFAEQISMPRIIRFSMSVVRLPTATSLSFDHFSILCSATARYYPAIFQSIPDSVDFIVACTRAQKLWIRNAALRSLMGLYDQESTPDVPQEIACQPERVHEALKQYGSHEKKQRKDRIDFANLLDTFADNPSRSLSDLRYVLVELILRNEPLVRNHFSENPTEESMYLTRDLGGTRFFDVLRLCGEAVGSSGPGSQTGAAAHILHLEYLLSSEQMDEAYEAARSCIKRHPSVAFFYYVVATCGNPSTSALFAEKGLLECSDLTNFLRDELLYCTALSSDLVIADMLTGTPTKIHWQEVGALMKKASTSAISFVNNAPLDHVKTPTMIALTIHLNVLMRGHTFSDDFKELQNGKDKLSLACDIARSQPDGFNPAKQCLALDTISSRMPIAWQAWKPIVSRHSSSDHSNTNNTDPTVDVAAWLEKLDTSDPVSKFLEIRGLNPDTDRYGPAKLHFCSACNMPSAVLRQCSRCQKTRYCDSEC